MLKKIEKILLNKKRKKIEKIEGFKELYEYVNIFSVVIYLDKDIHINEITKTTNIINKLINKFVLGNLELKEKQEISKILQNDLVENLKLFKKDTKEFIKAKDRAVAFVEKELEKEDEDVINIIKQIIKADKYISKEEHEFLQFLI